MNLSLRLGSTALLLSFASPAVLLASTLIPFDPSVDDTKVFTTEVKYDERVNDGAQQGHDVFLRNGDTFTGPSFNQNWGATGTEYDWLLSYDGDTASFTFDGTTRTLDINPDLPWNAVNIIARSTDDARFITAESTVTVDEVNGSTLGVAEIFSAELVEFNEHFRVKDTGEDLTSIGGTFRFDFEIDPQASGSPNSRYSFIVKGLNIPEPGAAMLALLACSALAMRRQS